MASIACSTSARMSSRLNEDDFSGLDLIHVENAADQMQKPLAIGVRDREQAQGGCRQRGVGIGDQKTKRAGNRGERCAQLVAQRGHELALQALDTQRSLISTTTPRGTRALPPT